MGKITIFDLTNPEVLTKVYNELLKWELTFFISQEQRNLEREMAELEGQLADLKRNYETVSSQVYPYQLLK